MEKKNLGFFLRRLFSPGSFDDEVFEELTDILIAGDLGAKEAVEITALLRQRVRENHPRDKEEVIRLLRDILGENLKGETLSLSPGVMNIFLILGVNGVGKTTTLAKLARYYQQKEGARPALAAGDTFRAAAADQLKIHGERLGIRVIAQGPGADPGAVIYDALTSALAKGENLILADTAGRMHNKENLLRELQKIHRVIQSRCEGANYKKILVIDATTGQNGFRQAETLHEAVGVDGIILTKTDSCAKGGIAFSICRELGIPFFFTGTGESYDSLEVFDRKGFLDALLTP
ncbi:MAG: signal recognition particle-docking protein FtsY [Spirochaetales bacterium]|nr:signal recognition particle-docking protein FtsY [Spirochaetales bacterium]